MWFRLPNEILCVSSTGNRISAWKPIFAKKDSWTETGLLLTLESLSLCLTNYSPDFLSPFPLQTIEKYQQDLVERRGTAELLKENAILKSESRVISWYSETVMEHWVWFMQSKEEIMV